MTPRAKKILKGFAVVAVIGALGTGYLLHRVALVGTSYASRVACSAIFLSGRDPATVEAEDLLPVNYPGLSIEVDKEKKRVTASLFTASTTSVYREGLGAVQVYGQSADTLQAQTVSVARVGPSKAPFPAGDTAVAHPQLTAEQLKTVKAAVEKAFADPDPERLKRTRAVVVVYDNHIVYQQYAKGIDPQTPLIGWSMTKSVMNTLIGLLVKKQVMAVTDPLLAPEWKGDAEREKISFDQCLRMSSGLEFGEKYGDPFADVVTMLFRRPNCGAYAADKALAFKPEEKWAYSSGTSNILARAIQEKIPGDATEDWNFVRRELFNKLKMTTAVLETDESGHYIGSSFMYASAKDWARFGLLYLNDGVAYGERLLPEGWADYSRKPTPKSNGTYGAHFWLNAERDDPKAKRRFPKLPTDLYMARGFQGQSVNIIPSRKAVIVRLGHTMKRKDWDLEEFLVDVLEGLPND
ncbi:MAG: serine hydrolase [Planctomycetota bacterium]|nr:serine hydrolase [Planctomycetota bacterium]